MRLIDESARVADVVLPLSGDSTFESDEVLASRGDIEGFISLYRRYLGPIYRYLYARLGGNRQEAEDVSSLAFERAWASLGHYKPTGSFRGWLFTIAARALVDHLRTGRSKSDPSRVSVLQESFLDPSLGPEENAILADQLRDVLRLISALGEEQREIIALRFIADLKYSEIAEVMKKREAAVKMMAYRALKEIRRRYRDEEF
jgi:RNA polymerase sigma factor (sigma-70 family)